MFLAGTRADIDSFLAWVRADARFADLEVKESFSDDQPFKYMLVKLKREIITMKHPLIKPEEGRAPVVTPTTLKRWLDQGHDDDGKPVVMMEPAMLSKSMSVPSTTPSNYRIENSVTSLM